MANLRVDKITSTETFEKTGSVQFDGSGDHLDVGTAGDFNYLHNGAASFTAEFWVYPQLVNSRQIIFSTGGNSSTTGFVIRIMSSGSSGSSNGYFVSAQTSKGSDGNYLYWDSDPTRLDADTWYHIAMVYDHTDNTLKIYVNGKLTNSGFARMAGTFGSHSTSNSTHSLHIGEEPFNNSKDLKGHLSNLRILNGVKLYTSNFKIPMRELEVVPGTVLLACQSKTDASLEKTGKTITVNGNAVASELTPGILTPVVKSGGGSAITGSVEFGKNDYLTLTPSTDFNFGTGDFTIEFWIHPQKTFTGYANIFNINDSVNASKFYINFRNGANLALTDATTVFAQNGLFNLDDWFHVAVVRTSGQSRVYMNGVGGSSVSCTRDFGGSNNGEVYIGFEYNLNSSNKYNGFISNFRIVKGTALYTDDFIPPTRELKRVPGTVLLCCQDPNNPLTEATGKTITGYGSLGDGGLGQELVTNDSVWTLTKGGSGATDWTVSNAGSSLAGTTVSGGYIRATYTLDKGDYQVSLRWTGGAFAVQDSTGYIVATDGTDTEFGASEDGAYSFYMTETTSVVITGTSWSTAYTVDDISIKRIYKNNGATNFTPQVGDDRQVTFEGVTKINTDAYFYLPTGDTITREATGTYNAGTRGVALGGDASSPNTDTIIDYITIASTGDAIDFGDLAINDSLNGDAVADHTRGVCLGGRSNVPTPNSRTNAIQFVTISSTGNSQDFGDLVGMKYGMAGFSDSTRGISAGGGVDPNSTTNIDYITISSKGNGQDFGDCIDALTYSAGFSSPTRGIKAGGAETPGSGVELNLIEYVTIQTTGSGQDFGDLIRPAYRLAGCSNAVRGVILEGETPAGDGLKAMSFVTIASMGNAQEFGDATTAGQHSNGTSSSTRGVFMGRQGASPYANLTFIDFVHIMTTANAQDFGDLTIGRQGVNACSNGHGGLG